MLESVSLVGDQWITDEERYDSVLEIRSPSYDEDQGSIRPPLPVVLADRSTAECVFENREHTGALGVLTHSKLRNELETILQIGSSRDPNRECSFSIGEST